MTLNKRKLKKLGESMWIHFTKGQEEAILEHFGTEPEPYEWSEEDIAIQIQNFVRCGEFVKSIQDNMVLGISAALEGFEDFDGEVDCDDYCECQCDIQHRSTKNTALGNEKYSSCQLKIQHEATEDLLIPTGQQQCLNNKSKQVKISVASDLAIAFKQACDAANITMTEKLSQYMAEYTNTAMKKPEVSYTTKRQRRTAVKSIIRQLEQIKAYEERYRDNIPENLQGSIVYDNADECVSWLEESIDILGLV
jgi:hypothetical protein